MTPVLLVRHGPTDWNESGRIQGRVDVELSARGRCKVAAWRLPPGWTEARVVASPLRRAYETAVLLTGRIPIVDDRLVEMDWGRWQGRRLAELRGEAPAAMAAREGRGLDFRPPGGESPRDVCARLESLFAELAADPHPVVAVCHKGVIRAALVLATGWNMQSKPPLRLPREMGCVVKCHPDGRPELGPTPTLAAAA